MVDQSPEIRDEAVVPRFVRSPKGHHAVPRTSALTRLRLPLGKALALTALPTALVLGSQRLSAVDTSATVAHSVPEEGAGGSIDCARPDVTASPAAAPTPSTAPSAPGAPTGDASGKPLDHVADEGATPVPAPTPTPALSPSASAASSGLADLLGSLLGGDSGQQGPAPNMSPSPSLAVPTPKATEPSDPPPAMPHASPTASHRAIAPSPPSGPKESTRSGAPTCDTSDLKAPEDTSAGRFAAESWNMKGSHLELRDLVFGGVVTVDTAAGPKRVLKFSASAVTIRDLKMAVPVGPQTQHIDGAPGSTSTLHGDHITMYVESLTGTLSGVEGIPLPPALRLHLTPDTVPEWLYDTLGKLDLKLQLDLGDADIDQAGQTGGELVIPGIHGYGTPR